MESAEVLKKTELCNIARKFMVESAGMIDVVLFPSKIFKSGDQITNTYSSLD